MNYTQIFHIKKVKNIVDPQIINKINYPGTSFYRKTSPVLGEMISSGIAKAEALMAKNIEKDNARELKKRESMKAVATTASAALAAVGDAAVQPFRHRGRPSRPSRSILGAARWSCPHESTSSPQGPWRRRRRQSPLPRGRGDEGPARPTAPRARAGPSRIPREGRP